MPVRGSRRVGDRGVVEQVDHPAEVGLVADRELERRDAGAEALLQLVEGPVERRPLAVELVHEDRAGDPTLVGEPPGDLGLHLDALDGGHHEHGEVGDPQRGGDVADEVGVARGVDQVDLVAVELERRDGERDRDVAPRGLGVEVADGGAVLDPPGPRDRPGMEQERLGERGLARRRRARRGRRCGSWSVGKVFTGRPHANPCDQFRRSGERRSSLQASVRTVSSARLGARRSPCYRGATP